MKPSELIDKALTETIPDERHWCQQTLAMQVGPNMWRHCMLGALGAARDGSQPDQLLHRNGVMLKALRAVIQSQPGCSIDSVITYNDAKGRTYDEVRAVMEKARADLQEKGL